jgi:hypothetical protein
MNTDSNDNLNSVTETVEKSVEPEQQSNENNLIRNILNEYSAILKIAYESEQEISIDEIMMSLDSRLRKDISQISAFSKILPMGNEIFHEILSVFMKENEEIIDHFVLRDTDDIIEISRKEIDNYPTETDIKELQSVAKNYQNENNESTEENESIENTQEIDDAIDDINNVDRLYSLLFGFEKLVGDSTVDLKLALSYIIKFNLLRYETIKFITENSSNPKEDLENTGLNKLNVGTMIDVLKTKISSSDMQIIIKNMKYYTIKYKN